MAATLQSGKQLDKLDIIKICEEILNPPVPIALRISGTLLGGVVIVYQRKVKLLYDDVSQLLTEINKVWPIIKLATDPTVLPKGKAQAKHEEITLPQPMMFSEADADRFRGMRLDEQYLNVNLHDDDISCAKYTHQAEAVNITLVDEFGHVETDVFDRFERFDIVGDVPKRQS